MSCRRESEQHAAAHICDRRTAAGRLWSIRQNHPESESDVLNVYHCQQRVYEEIYVKEQVSLEGDECSFPSAPTAVPAGAGRAPLWIRFTGQGSES